MKILATLPALFLIGLAILIAIGTSGLRYWDGITPGAAFFPVWLAGAGALLAVILLFQQSRGHSLGDIELPDASGFLRVVMTIAAMIAMGLIAPVIGMVAAVAVFIGFMLVVVLRQALLPSIVTAAVVAGTIELVFVRWLGVALPAIPFLS